MRVLLLAIVLMMVSLSANAASIKKEEIVSNQVTRTFYLVTPDHPDSKSMPVVLVLHGHGGTAANALGLHGIASPLAAWISITDREHIVVVALQGVTGADGKPGWKDCRDDAPGNPTIDDVLFAHDVIARLQQRALIDTSRIYVMGMSNGAMMSQRLAIELDPPVAAFAAVSGSMAAHSVCSSPTHPVAALLIHGTADPLVPYGGGDVHFFKRKRGGVMSVDDTVQFWLHVDHLATSASTSNIEHRDVPNNPTHALREVYGLNPTMPQVELIKVTDGGHIEPSLKYHYGSLYELIVGKQNQDLESAEEAWLFFKDKKIR